MSRLSKKKPSKRPVVRKAKPTAEEPENVLQRVGRVIDEANKNVLEQMIGLATEITADVPARVWKELPRDLSKNVDHYLYGTAKREKE